MLLCETRIFYYAILLDLWELFSYGIYRNNIITLVKIYIGCIVNSISVNFLHLQIFGWGGDVDFILYTLDVSLCTQKHIPLFISTILDLYILFLNPWSFSDLKYAFFKTTINPINHAVKEYRTSIINFYIILSKFCNNCMIYCLNIRLFTFSQC